MITNSDESQYYFLREDNLLRGSDSYSQVKSLRLNSNWQDLRDDFPILKRKVNNKPLVWLDNAATTQKPLCVIDALSKYYGECNSNVHRGAHTLAQVATKAYDEAREKVRSFIDASSQEEIIFVRGATEAINLVANSFGDANIMAGDEIILTAMEHHSNIVPWQTLAKIKGAKLRIVPINDKGEVILKEYQQLLSHRTRIVAIAHVSNLLGTINPVEEMIQMAHRYGARVLIDGAQAVPHLGLSVQKMDADFYVFSGHKCYGPTGIGVLYGKKAILEEMKPWQKGGGMIKNVNFEETQYNVLPHKFEAGTGNIGDAIALGSAIDYLQKIGMNRIETHEKALTVMAMERLSKMAGLNLIGTAQNKTSVVSFKLDGIDDQVAADLLNQEGIALRSGHHCAQPALEHYGLISSIRASLGIYNTSEEIEFFISCLEKIIARK